MKRRCYFLDNLAAFNYNTGVGEVVYDETSGKELKKTDTRKLGSTLMQTMLEEVGHFCDQNIGENCAEKPQVELEVTIVFLNFILILHTEVDL